MKVGQTGLNSDFEVLSGTDISWQKSCRDQLMRENCTFCAEPRLARAGCVRIVFQLRHQPKNYKSELISVSDIDSDVALNKIFDFAIFSFCSIAYGRKYFLLSMSVF